MGFVDKTRSSDSRTQLEKELAECDKKKIGLFFFWVRVEKRRKNARRQGEHIYSRKKEEEIMMTQCHF